MNLSISCNHFLPCHWFWFSVILHSWLSTCHMNLSISSLELEILVTKHCISGCCPRRITGTFAIFTNIQTGCNLVKNSLNDLQTVRILPLNNPLPLGAFTNPSLFCSLCHDQWVLANHSSSLQPLQLLHRSLVRLFWSFTCNNNAQILHLGRCECEFGSTMAW
jgi:hypothetical protein